jgi:hypothetical protein
MEFKEKATIVPRPGVKAQQSIILKGTSFKASDRDEANLEAEINEFFAEPNEIGTLEHVFRSNVRFDELLGVVTVQTNTDFITDEEAMKVKSIAEDELGVTFSDWEMKATIGRKSFGVDEA